MAKAKAASAKKSKVTANMEVVPGKKSPLKKFKQVGNKDSFKILEGFGGESPTGRAVVFSIVCDEKGDLTGDIVIWQSVTVKRDQDSGQLEISGKPKLVKASKDDKTERTDVIGDLNVTVQFPSGPASMSISSVAYGSWWKLTRGFQQREMWVSLTKWLAFRALWEGKDSTTKKLRAVISHELGQRARFILSGEGFENGNRVQILSTMGSGSIEWTVQQPTTAQKRGTRLMFFATPNRAETKKTESDMTDGNVLGDLNVTVTFADGTSSQTMTVPQVAFLDP